MNEVHILPTDNSPEVILKPNGTVKIKGRGMVVNKTRIPEQINDWLDAYLLNPAETTYVIVAFEYLNSYSTTILASVLKKISQVILQNKKFIIHWYYEDDDDDLLDRGGYISESLKLPIDFIVVDDISGC
ncbi:MAG: SiaC family regulatory phosphoprotein [Prolixibacteraceae bacterium]|nr:SiaC family regulatory phosphoprotein [Prolixibacteraceae bacterium]